MPSGRCFSDLGAIFGLVGGVREARGGNVAHVLDDLFEYVGKELEVKHFLYCFFGSRVQLEACRDILAVSWM